MRQRQQKSFIARDFKQAFFNNRDFKEMCVEYVFEHASTTKQQNIKNSNITIIKSKIVSIIPPLNTLDQYPSMLGMPLWFATTINNIYNNLPIGDDNNFLISVLDAIKCGINLDIIKNRLAILRIEQQLLTPTSLKMLGVIELALCLLNSNLDEVWELNLALCEILAAFLGNNYKTNLDLTKQKMLYVCWSASAQNFDYMDYNYDWQLEAKLLIQVLKHYK